MLHRREDGGTERITFDTLKGRTNRLANTLRAHGIGRGDRVAVLLPQVPETAVAHLAAFKLGAISVPLFQLFGEQALEFRLRDCGAAAVSPMARFVETVVLPTPPLGEAMVMTRPA